MKNKQMTQQDLEILVENAFVSNTFDEQRKNEILTEAVESGMDKYEAVLIVDNYISAKNKYKKCPFCGANIPVISKVCSFCNKDLPEIDPNISKKQIKEKLSENLSGIKKFNLSLINYLLLFLPFFIIISDIIITTLASLELSGASSGYTIFSFIIAVDLLFAIKNNKVIWGLEDFNNAKNEFYENKYLFETFFKADFSEIKKIIDDFNFAKKNINKRNYRLRKFSLIILTLMFSLIVGGNFILTYKTGIIGLNILREKTFTVKTDYIVTNVENIKVLKFPEKIEIIKNPDKNNRTYTAKLRFDIEINKEQTPDVFKEIYVEVNNYKFNYLSEEQLYNKNEYYVYFSINLSAEEAKEMMISIKNDQIIKLKVLE